MRLLFLVSESSSMIVYHSSYTMVCRSVNLDSGVENIALEGNFIKLHLIRIHLDEIVKYFSLDSSKTPYFCSYFQNSK